MKRFIIISLLAVLTAAPSAACIWYDNHNSYLFCPYDPDTFKDRTERVTLSNWKAYLGKTEDYYYFDADEITEFAQKKGDALMVSYVRHLEQYLKCAEEKRREQWDYPTKQQLAQRRQTLLNVRTYAQGKLKSRLRSQHALLFMRCNMMLGRHQENLQFWQQTANNFIESVYKDMMQNIYAGALLQTGKNVEAARLFAEQGDWESLMTQYYEHRSCKAIRQEYLRDPGSAVLPFLLKDFVNNAQEAVDAANDDWALGGKLFIRNITKDEANQMCQLASQVVSENKTPVPAMWQTAKAWLEFLFGNHRQGLADIQTAMKMEGTEQMKDNARVLKLYMTATESPLNRDFDDYLATELEWLQGKAAQNDFFERASDRLVYQVLEDKYRSRPTTDVALLKAMGSYNYSCWIDTMRVETLLQYLDYVKSPAQTPLDRFLKSRQDFDANQMNDLVGTKYLRQCRWQEAAEWLDRVPLSYYSETGYAIYAHFRKWSVEPWIKRQWLTDDIQERVGKQQLKENPKKAFALEMQKMEAQLNVLTGQSRQQCCYDLAVRYAQAHFTGDCWFLMRDGKSIGDTLRQNETDLAKKAVSLLQQASQTSDFALKERALFALCYGYLHPVQWQTEEWDDEECSFVKKFNNQSSHYQALAAFARFEQANAAKTSNYVSRCDEFKQFRKAYQ